MRVLLADDDEDDFLLTRELIEEIPGRPYEVEWCRTAAESRNAVINHLPDVCLLDYRLGPDDGIELTKDIIELGFAGPIIILTGQRDLKLENRALACGAVDYLVKSFLSSDQLERVIRYGITRKQFENERLDRISAEARQRQAESANKAKTDFIAYMSHELRTPLAAILSYAELAAMRTNDANIREFASHISRNGEHLHSLLNDIFDLSKIEAGKLDLEVGRISTEQLLSIVVSSARVSAEARGLEFNVAVPAEIPKFLRADGRRLRQILLNLLGNAIKYTDEGSVSLRIVFDSDSPSAMGFEVIDTGIGIAGAEFEHIFKPFLQLESGKSRGRGVGLGLAISSELARQLGGRIDVQSTEGKGSIFQLSFESIVDGNERIQFDPESALAAMDSSYDVASLSGHIIVVDDVADIGVAISHILTDLGATVTNMTSGVELLEAARAAEEPQSIADLVLLDMQMPEIDGYTTASELRDLGYSGPVIALTAVAMRGAREQCLAAGCDDYLSKPIDHGRFVQKVQHWLTFEEEDSEVPRVLVVDDAENTREPLAELLRAQGLSVWTAADAESARRLSEETQPHAVLLDISLAGSSGIDLAQKLRRQSIGSRLVALTGSKKDEFTDAELEQFDGFLTKPVSVQNILRTLSSLNVGR